MAHNVAVGVGVKVLDGKGLHMGEHPVPDLFQDPLGDDHHDPIVQEGGDDADGVNGGHHQDGPEQAGKIGDRFNEQGLDVIVNQRFGKQGRKGAGQGAEDNADDYHSQLEFVLKNVVKQPLRRAFMELYAGSLHVFSHFLRLL